MNVKKNILQLGIPYAIVTFPLRNVFDTALGHILYAISFYALIFGVIWFIARLLYLSVKQQLHNWRYKKHSK